MKIPFPKKSRTARFLLFASLPLPLLPPAIAAETSAFPAYVDSEICARLMLGPVTPARINCGSRTLAEGANPVLVQLSNNMVLSTNDKMIRPLVGQLVEVSGRLDAENATMKLESIHPIQASSISPRDPAQRFLDPHRYNTPASAQLREKIRFQLARVPYLTDWDFISFTIVDSDVILTGWTQRDANRSSAENLVKSVRGVELVVNNIEVLPITAGDNQIRYQVRVQLRQKLPNYFFNGASDIRIIVKNGSVILIGTVKSKEDYDIAYKECDQLPFIFKIFNLLQIRQ